MTDLQEKFKDFGGINMDYVKFGVGLEEFYKSWCENINCCDCPLKEDKEDGDCAPSAIGRVVSHIKLLGGFNAKTMKEVCEFENQDISGIEKCKRVHLMARRAMLRELIDEVFKEDDE